MLASIVALSVNWWRQSSMMSLSGMNDLVMFRMVSVMNLNTLIMYGALIAKRVGLVLKPVWCDKTAYLKLLEISF